MKTLLFRSLVLSLSIAALPATAFGHNNDATIALLKALENFSIGGEPPVLDALAKDPDPNASVKLVDPGSFEDYYVLNLMIDRGVPVADVARLVDLGADVNRPFTDVEFGVGATTSHPVMQAVKLNRLEILGLLLKSGGDPNAVDPRYCHLSPIQIAAARDIAGAIPILLDAGADVNAEYDIGPHGCNASTHNALEIVIFERWNEKSFRAMVAHASPASLKKMMAPFFLYNYTNALAPGIEVAQSYGADTNILVNGDSMLLRSMSWSPEKLDASFVTFLIDHGNDVNLQREPKIDGGSDALRLAASQRNDPDLVKLLLSRRAKATVAALYDALRATNWNKANQDEWSRSQEAAELIIQAGVDLNADSSYIAAKTADQVNQPVRGAAKVVEAIANPPYDANAAESFQNKLLFLRGHGAILTAEMLTNELKLVAANQGIISEPAAPADACFVNALKKAGFDFRARTRAGSPVLFPCVLWQGYVSLLVSVGADINETDLNGRTAVMELLAHYGRSSLVPDALNALLKFKPDLKAKDHTGLTALDYAKKFSDPRVQDILKRAGG